MFATVEKSLWGHVRISGGWHVATGQELFEIDHAGHAVRRLLFSQGGRRLVCLTAESRIIVLSIPINDDVVARFEDSSIGIRP
jgi:hypothetical protein